MEVEEEGKTWEGPAETCLSLKPGSSIPICYHQQFGPHDDLLLLEVDDKILPDVLQNRVLIRGQPAEDAVLCTHSSTYAMKFVGTSNSVFLISPGGSTPTMKATAANDKMGSSVVASVITVAQGNIELIQVEPKLDKLKKLLSEKPYNPEEDFNGSARHKKGLYRWQDLVEMIQASEEEVRAALKSLSAVEIDGYWRIVDDKTMNETLNMILRNSVLHDWSISALSEERILSLMEADGFLPRVVLHCLEAHGSKLYGSDGTLWRLDEKQVCLRFALCVLSRGKMKLESFVEKWEQSVPSGMKADLKMLEGEVLYEKIGFEEWIRVFSVSTLPSNPADRFAALFRERPKWEWKDLEPYIRDIHVPGLSSEGLLIKYSRRTQATADAEPIFSSR
ncbi:sister chromatid cohesion protein DCC1 [Phalaenopsis equestris]|uniref:sister chromatid cohesion protein DCC1 n=1 Tax=Phalaenopsis equestris TaxID=78828 RepID=UPI0009E214C6|nr:sister chromatid cohesion protein DCC1 [Phalaenopsis equestris]